MSPGIQRYSGFFHRRHHWALAWWLATASVLIAPPLWARHHGTWAPAADLIQAHAGHSINQVTGHFGLGCEREEGPLFFRARAHTIITDDAAFVTLLDQAGISYLPPALALIELVDHQQLEPRAALEGLERMRTLIRLEIYRMARSNLEAFPRRKPQRSSEGESP